MVNPTKFQLVKPNIQLLNNLSEGGRSTGSVGGNINLNVNKIETKP